MKLSKGNKNGGLSNMNEHFRICKQHFTISTYIVECLPILATVTLFLVTEMGFEPNGIKFICRGVIDVTMN